MVDQIHFGVLCNSSELKKWQIKCLENLIENCGANLKLVIVNNTERIETFLPNFNYAFWKVYSRFLVNPKLKGFEDCRYIKNCENKIYCSVNKKGKFSQYFKEEDVSKIKQYDLDFMLRFGFNIIRGEILNAAKHGVWSFHHGDEKKYRGGPPCFWEIYNKDNTTGLVLQKLTDRLDGGIILEKGFLRTNHISYVKNINNVFIESSNLIKRACLNIQHKSEYYEESTPSKTKAKIYKKPNFLQLLYFLFLLIYNFIKAKTERVWTYDWNIGIVYDEMLDVLQKERLDITWFQDKSNNEFYIADPFGIEKNGESHILYEKLNFQEGVGKISTLKIDKSGQVNYSDTENVFNTSSHLSYPFLFENNGHIYCIPENNASNGINIFKAINFPNKWRKEKTITSCFPGVDPTITRFNGCWYIFCTIRGKANSHLYIWYSKELFGNWSQHYNNPVKININSSRPAGTPIYYNGDLFRPAQICSKTYGGGIVINKVKKLTPYVFEETEYKSFYPDKDGDYPLGIHTISNLGKFTLIDGKRKVFNYEVLKKRILGKFKI